MKYKIITDSSSNLQHLDTNVTVIPLMISTSAYQYQDNTNLDINAMLSEITKDQQVSITTTTQSWLDAFEDAELILCVTFTSHLSNSYASAREAKEIYEKQYSNRKVLVIDSLSCGPEIQLLISKLKDLIALHKSYREIRNTIMDYKQRTRLFFSSQGMDIIPSNGRINPAISNYTKKLGYRTFGKANFDGNLVSTQMMLGFKKMIDEMKASGYQGGRLIISHTQNEKNALKLQELLKEAFGNIQVEITKNAGICSYYLQKGGILVGFEV